MVSILNLQDVRVELTGARFVLNSTDYSQCHRVSSVLTGCPPCDSREEKGGGGVALSQVCHLSDTKSFKGMKMPGGRENF